MAHVLALIAQVPLVPEYTYYTRSSPIGGTRTGLAEVLLVPEYNEAL